MNNYFDLSLDDNNDEENSDEERESNDEDELGKEEYIKKKDSKIFNIDLEYERKRKIVQYSYIDGIYEHEKRK